MSAIIDCSTTSPVVKGAAYSSSSIKKSYVIPGMRNEIDGCPDIYAAMKASNVNFQANPSLESLLLNSLRQLTAEMYTNKQGIPESMFDELGFPIDEDVQGNYWHLTSKSVVFGRSQPIISDKALQRRTALMVKDLEISRVAKV